jgi:hypothetical protein
VVIFPKNYNNLLFFDGALFFVFRRPNWGMGISLSDPDGRMFCMNLP